MNTNNKIIKNIVTLTTTTPSNGFSTVSADAADDDQLRKILLYAIPLSCLIIFFIITGFIAIRQRHRILDKWSSLKRMRNTNPKFLQNTGLRRDSEFDSYNHVHVKSKVMHQENSLQQQRQYHLLTIT
ncbi:unnamed protein product [Rotaria sp. Silwood1]|nr:unnamed protein product [Rotaria sp. Silwood1]CAF0971459.1 unnamed protein product [Rotaria sp. Silwood1]CAF3415235.1 unnamed protein product [Rotaria sp. Silwood1]CAF3415644.1 unnamed protein product [Rotaria sp. Silwood1]CAF4765526.1 unnamed protein product [Rotaria sp. Silwood1]